MYVCFICRIAILYRQPPLAFVQNIYVLPLTTAVWKFCFFLLLVTFLVMLSQIIHPAMKRRMTPFDTATFVWGAVCQQGSALLLSNTSGRVAVFTIYLGFLALFTSYAANITALLQSPSAAIKTIDDLIHSPLKLSIQEAGYNRYFFQDSKKNSLIRQVYEKKALPQGDKGWIYNTIDGVKRLRTELLAFHVETKAAYKFIAKMYTESEKCSLSEIQLVCEITC